MRLDYYDSNIFKSIYTSNIIIKVSLFTEITDCEAPTLANASSDKQVIKHNEKVTYLCNDGYYSNETLSFTCSDGKVDLGDAQCKR